MTSKPVSVKVPTISVSSNNPSPNFELSTSHLIGIGVAITAALLLTAIVAYWRGKVRGTCLSVEHFDRRLAEQHKASFEEIEAIQNNVQKALNSCRLIPNGQVLLPLEEGQTSHVLASGYVLRIDRKLEHRAIAEEVLGRELATNEVVHHIYAPDRQNNNLKNLCVLDRDSHELLHTHLKRKKDQTDRYPSTSEQRHFIKATLSHIFLDEAAEQRKSQFPQVKPKID